eukprot:m.107576 g.107576  ORF g.107576 m.107576 type:complete len:355 (+) comp22585_c0_seq1:55-1119(+)
MEDLVDVDANLCHPQLYDNITEHICRAQHAGVRQFVVPGSTLEDSSLALTLASEKFPNVVFSTAGIHPYNVKPVSELPDALSELERLLSLTDATPSSSLIARCVGECGLDFSEHFPSPETQIPWFEKQVELACRLQRPLFLHERAAFKPFVDILEKQESLPPVLVHCFTSGEKELEKYLAMGFFIGMTGFFLTKRGAHLLPMLPRIPLNRIMVETDAPYLGFPGCRSAYPGSKRKQTTPNVPSALPQVVTALAEKMKVTVDELAQHCTQNARQFFSLTSSPPPSLVPAPGMEIITGQAPDKKPKNQKQQSKEKKKNKKKQKSGEAQDQGEVPSLPSQDESTREEIKDRPIQGPS